MFNLQGSELIIILLLALVVLGPEKLPDAMRKLGQLYAEIRKMSSGFQQEFRSVMDEPMQEMRDTANLLRDSADFTKLQDGERDEKPKSAEMPTDGDPEPAPTDEVPFRESDDAAGPDAAATDAAATAAGGAPTPVADDEPNPPPPFGRNPMSVSADTADVPDADGAAPADPEPSRPRPFGPGQMSSAAPRAQPPAPASVPDRGDAPPTDGDAAEASTVNVRADEAPDEPTVRASAETSHGVDESDGLAEAPGPDAPGDPTR